MAFSAAARRTAKETQAANRAAKTKEVIARPAVQLTADQSLAVISKVAEEAGEVVKAAIHCAEGRETAEAVIGEITQAMAMLMRLYVDGDQVHGLPSLAAMETDHDHT